MTCSVAKMMCVRTRDYIGDKYSKILDEAKRDVKKEIIQACF